MKIPIVLAHNKKQLVKGIIIFAAIFVFLLWVKYIEQERKKTNLSLYQIKCVLKKQEQILQDKTIIAEETELAKERLKDIDKKIWTDKTPQIVLSSFIEDLEVLSQRSNIQILSKNTLPPKKIGLLNQIPINLRLKCNSEVLTNFLYSLENAPKLYHLNYISVLPQEGGTTPANGQLQISLTIYSWQKDITTLKAN